MPIAVFETVSELRKFTTEARAEGRRIALVPTMGALHDGHAALVRRALEVADVVVVSIFVNPLQFAPTEDLDKYPRTLRNDIEMLGSLEATAAFTPNAAEMYPNGTSETRVTAGAVGELYEGHSREGHFDGVLTVVSKLVNIVAPDVVLFGQKDAQQVFLVTQMTVDLDLTAVVETVPTIREHDGLALSSRNRFLAPDERSAARNLARALDAAGSSADRGVNAAVSAARLVLESDPMVETDYLEVVDPLTFRTVTAEFSGTALMLVAARVGTTRLIDNAVILIGALS